MRELFGLSPAPLPHHPPSVQDRRHEHIRWKSSEALKQPASKLKRGTFTTSVMPLKVPPALRKLELGSSHPIMARGWTWLPPTTLSTQDFETLRDNAIVRKRVYTPGAQRGGGVPAWKRAVMRRKRAEALAAAAASGSDVPAEDAAPLETVVHHEGGMPLFTRRAWPEGALPMYRNYKNKDTGGVWIPRALAAHLWPTARTIDKTSDGLPLRPSPPPEISFLPHIPQQAAHDAVLHFWNTAPAGGAACTVLMPCGYGKLITGLMAIRSAGRRAIWVVMRQTLADDAFREIDKVFPGAVSWMPAKQRRKRTRGGTAAAAAAVPVVAGEQGARPFTKAVLDGTSPASLHPGTCDADILVVSIHTLVSRCASYTRADWESFGTIVIDEMHMMSHKYIHALASIPARRILGLSATPYRSDGTTAGLFWAFGPLIFAARRPSMTLMGEIWRWDGGPAVVKRVGREIDEIGTLTALCEGDIARRVMIVSGIRACLAQGRRILVMGMRIGAYLRILAADVRKHETTRSHFVKTAVPPADVDKDFSEDGVQIEADGVWLGAAACVHQGTPKWLRQVILHNAPCACAHPGLAKFGVSCPTLDTVLIATPLPDPEQIVGRITRANSVGKVPLIIDILDAHEPFLKSWASRQTAYDFLDMELQYRTMQRAVTLDEAAECLAVYDRDLNREMSADVSATATESAVSVAESCIT